MKSICFYFQVHQPFRLKTYRFFEIGNDHSYFDEYANRFMIRQLAEKCYLPANQVLLELIKKHKDDFKVTFSISGMALEQFELYAPEVLDSFKSLAKTGNVEFLAETYAHGLSALKSKKEFARQVKLHEKKIQSLFGVKPGAFRNTELIYNNDIGDQVFKLGYNTVLTEGPKHILGWKTPNLLYCSAVNPKVKLLMKNFQLSDDIAFRFSVKEWSEWPLTAEKYAGWLKAVDPKTEVVNLFLDYETFGQNQSKKSGIFEFLMTFPQEVLKNTEYTFQTPSQLSKNLQPASPLNIPHPISWADEERDITAWLGNEMQTEAFNKLYDLEPLIGKCSDADILNDWNRLQTSDHFYYMSTKWFSEGVVKTRINPYSSPYDAFINYMNVLVDFEIRVKKICEKPKNKTAANMAGKSKTGSDATSETKPKTTQKKATSKTKKADKS
ncbi:MAG: alpha-amylase [Bacteroidetes bacterium]|nr:MAG: alpha-amylase [Bacteroidota bacterium]